MEAFRFGRSDIDPFPGRAVGFSGYTALDSAADGSIDDRHLGLTDFDTRILSRYRLLLDGGPVPLVSSAMTDWSRRTIILRRPSPGGTPEGPRLPRDGIEVAIRRRLGRGMLDEIEVANHSMVAAAVTFDLEVDADFEEIIAREGDDRDVGAVSVAWDEATLALTFEFRAEHGGRTLVRGTRVRVLRGDGAGVVRAGERGLRFGLDLAPKGSARRTVVVESLVDGAWRSPLELGSDRDDAIAAWHARRAGLETPALVVARAFDTAADDLAALRMWELDELAGAPDAEPAGSAGSAEPVGSAEPAWIPAAGMPMYPGVFGRDILTTGWQSLLLAPDIARGALEVAARTQATVDDAEHDAEPGKMIHEMRRGPLSDLGILPQRAYYGSQTTPAMFLIALSELWHWTGDDGLLRRHLDAALRTFEWAARWGDPDRDGFLEYERRATYGPRNQGWKDSDDAIRYPDGRNVDAPIATVEEQAFHYIALQRMAEILIALDDPRADGFIERAGRLRERFEAAYWMADAGFYAMGLDAGKEQIRSIGSNAGHALAAAIVAPERAQAVASRLFAPDLFSGWGVRTLSRDHPSYNPFSYHLGSVWPVEQATFALGLKRYGLDDEVERLVSSQFHAASIFAGVRLPEALSGHGTDEREAPSIYPRANSPQAWSASAMVQLVQILLGLYPFAPLGVLALVRPRLPAWLPVVTLRGLRVGDARLTLRFERTSDGAVHHDVIEQTGRLIVLPAPPPQAIRGGDLGESVKGWAIEHAPGRLARALRVGLGQE